MACLFFLLTIATDASEWEEINNEDNILVYRKSQPNSNFYIFKGQGIVNAPLPRILAIVQETRLMPKWVSSCVEAKLIEKNYNYATLKKNIDDYFQVIYGRAAVPWPFLDRDYVLKGKIAYDPANKGISIRLHNIEHAMQPRRHKVTRMKVLRIEFIMVPLAPGKTKLTFTVALDPGGNIPAWAVNYMSKKEPLKTIQSLRKLSSQIFYDSAAENMIRRQLLYLEQQ
jgi:hypothetical protein